VFIVRLIMRIARPRGKRSEKFPGRAEVGVEFLGTVPTYPPPTWAGELWRAIFYGILLGYDKRLLRFRENAAKKRFAGGCGDDSLGRQDLITGGSITIG
jgi:hypothetical protein